MAQREAFIWVAQSLFKGQHATSMAWWVRLFDLCEQLVSAVYVLTLLPRAARTINQLIAFKPNLRRSTSTADYVVLEWVAKNNIDNIRRLLVMQRTNKHRCYDHQKWHTHSLILT